MGNRYHDELGQGNFCNSLWSDGEGLFCSVRVAEGRLSAAHCPYSNLDCHVVEVAGASRLRCGKERACEDFEPAPWLREKFGVE